MVRPRVQDAYDMNLPDDRVALDARIDALLANPATAAEAAEPDRQAVQWRRQHLRGNDPDLALALVRLASADAYVGATVEIASGTESASDDMAGGVVPVRVGRVRVMTGADAGAGGSMAVDQELREDALDVLRDALVWRLEPARWAAVAVAVNALADALHVGDVEAVRAAVYDLELAGPVRAVGVGDTPQVVTPEQVREEINELIHRLDGRDVVED
jgi:hypothetical protein